MKHEGPALQYPDRLRIGVGHSRVDGPTQPIQVLDLAARRCHLDERVRGIQVIRAIESLLFRQKQRCRAGKQWIQRVQQLGLPLDPFDAMCLGIRELLQQCGRYMTGEALQHGRHPQLALPSQDLLLQLHVPVNPMRGQRSTPSIQTAHPLKRQIRRTRQKIRYLFVIHPQLPTDRLPNRLLTRHRKRHVHAVQGHPVDQLLPLLPIPPGQ